MNFANILSRIAEIDPEVYERTSTRRRVVSNWMPKVALATLPVALGSLFNKAYAKGSDAKADITAVLQLALTAERLESFFYAKALSMNTVPTSRPTDVAAIQLIGANEEAHRKFVESTLLAFAGQSAVDAVPNKFDYTGGKGTNAGPFTDVFTNYVTFLGVSQAFEETGVRAYKGGAPLLMSDHTILQAALQLHSVEGRHAAKIRQLRAQNGQASVKPWITQAISGIPNPAAQPTYAGENNTLQAGIDMVAASGLSSNAVTEAFDEPLGADAVKAILANFIAP